MKIISEIHYYYDDSVFVTIHLLPCIAAAYPYNNSVVLYSGRHKPKV